MVLTCAKCRLLDAVYSVWYCNSDTLEPWPLYENLCPDCCAERVVNGHSTGWQVHQVHHIFAFRKAAIEEGKKRHNEAQDTHPNQ